MTQRKKTGGRAKGTPNKTTTELRERFTSLLESNIDTIQNDLNTLEPKDRIKTLLEISKFVIPTLKAVENKIDFDEDLRFDFTPETIKVVIVNAPKED
jgi:hypothetical protein